MYQHTATFYDFFSNTSAQSEKLIKFLSKLIPSSPVTVIDVGSGLGDLTLHLAEQDHTVFCFEPSEDMYALFIDRLKRYKLFHSNITAVPLRLESFNGSIDADVAVAANVLSHCNAEEKIALIQALQKQLKPGGKLILNCAQPLADRTDQERTHVASKMIGELVYHHAMSAKAVDEFTHEVSFYFDVEHNGQIIKSYGDQFTLKMESLENVKKLLLECGFTVKNTYASYGKEAYSPEGSGFVIVAEKF